MERSSLRRAYGRRIFRGALFATTALVLPVLAPRAAVAQIAPNATPQGGTVVGGLASIAQAPGSTTINQASQLAAINWQSFNVGASAKVQFNQPNSGAVALNRVVGGNLSQINGQINANGQIVLINQSGVVFGQGAEVNAESVVVSTSDVATSDFMAGRLNFTGAPNPGAKIVNNGNITARDAGLVGLVAPQVANNGVITAQLGQVVLAGASAFTLDLYGDRLISLDVTQAVRAVDVNGRPVPALVTNSGLIIADGGKVTLTAADADALVTQLINAGGTIRADTVGAQTGTISVQGVGGNIQIAGNLLARGTAAGTSGGSVQVLADGTVAVAPAADIDVSGDSGGGSAAIGTNLARAQMGPADTLAPAAEAVLIAPGAAIHADATRIGNAGTVTLLSQYETDFEGAITGQGGPLGGNGGLAEISSRGVISLSGTVLETAAEGQAGEILLDPQTLVVVTGGNASSVSGGGTITFGGFTGGGTSNVDPAKLDSLSGIVILEASKLVSVASAIDMTNASVLSLVSEGSISVTAGITVDGSLDLDAAGSLFVAAPLSATNILLTSGAGGTDIDALVSAASTVTLGSGGTIFEDATSGTIDAVTLLGSGAIGGDLSLSGSGNDIVDLGSLTAANINIADSVALTVSGSVLASGTLDLADSVSLSVAQTIIAADVTIAAPTLGLDATIFATQASGATLGIAADDIIVTAGTFNVSEGAGGTIEVSPFSASVIDFGTASSAGTLGLPNAVIHAFDPNAAVIEIGYAPAGTQASQIRIDGSVSFALSPLVSLAPSGLIFDNAGKFTAGTLEINAAGVNQAGTGSLNVGSLGLASGGDDILIGGNTIGAADISAVGSIVLNDVESLVDSGSIVGEDVFVTIALGGGTFSLGGAGDSIATGTGGTLAVTADNLAQAGGNLTGGFAAPGGTIALSPYTGSHGIYVDALGNAPAGNLALRDDFFDALASNASEIVLGNSAMSGTIAIGRVSTDNAELGTAALDLVTGGTILETGTLRAGTLSFSGNSFLQDPTNSTIVAAALTGTASTALSGTVSLASTHNQISALGSLTAKTLTLTTSVALAVTGAVDAGNIDLTASALTFDEAVTATGVLSLDATGGAVSGTIGQDAAGTLTTGTLDADAGNFIDLEAGNSFGTLGALSAANAILLGYTGTLNIAGFIEAGGTLALENGGAVTELAGGTISATTLTSADTTLSGVVNLSGANNSITTLTNFMVGNGFGIKLDDNGLLNLAGTVSGGTISLSADTLILTGALNAGTLLALGSDNGIFQTAGTISAPTLDGIGAIGGGDVTLTGANDIGTIGTFEVAAGNLLLNDTAALTITGTLSTPDEFLFEGGSLVEAGGTIVAGTLGATGTLQGDVLLTGDNGISTLSNFAATGAFALNDTLQLDIDGLVSAAAFSIGGAGVTEVTGGIIDAGTLAGLGGISGSVLLNGGNSISVLSNISFVTDGLWSFQLTDLQSLDISGVVNFKFPDEAFVFSGAGLTESGTGAIDANNFSTGESVSGDILLTGTNAIAAFNFGNVTAAGTIDVNDTVSLFILDSVAAQDIYLAAPEIEFEGATIIAGSAIDPGTLAFATNDFVAFLPAPTIDAPDGTLEITPFSAGTTIDFGALSSSHILGLSDALLSVLGGDAAFILIGTAAIGSAAAAIDIGGSASFGGTATVELATSSLIHDNAGTFTAATLEIAAPVSQALGATIDAGLLEGIGDITGNILLLGGANEIGTISNVSLSGTLGLNDKGEANPLSLAGTIEAAAVTLEGNGLLFGGLLSASGMLDLFTPSGDAMESGGTIDAGTLAGSIAGAVTFTAANDIGTINVFEVAAGNILLNDTAALTIIGTLYTPGEFLFEGGSLVEAGGTIDAGTLATTQTLQGDALLTGDNGIGTLSNFAATGQFALNDTLQLDIDGRLFAAAASFGGAGVTEVGGGFIDAGTVAGIGGIGGDVLLNSSNNIIQALRNLTLTGTLDVADGSNLSLDGISAAAATFSNVNVLDSLSFAGAVSVAGALELDFDFGNYAGAGAISAGTLDTAGDTANDLVLTGANSIATLAAFTSDNDFDLNDLANLTIAGALSAPTIALASPEILLDAPITAGGISQPGTLAIISDGITAAPGEQLSAPTGTIEIEPLTDSVIDFGGSAAGALDLTGSIFGAANEIVIGGLPLGNPLTVGSEASSIEIDGSESLGGAAVVDLATTGTIFDNSGTFSAAILLIDGGILQNTAAAFDAGTLLGAGPIDANIDLAGTSNQIGTIGAFKISGGHDFVLTDSSSLDLAGALHAQDVTIADSAAIDLAAPISVATGGVIQLQANTLSDASASITAPGGTVEIYPFSGGIDLGGSAAGGLELDAGLLSLIGAGLLSIGTAGGGTIFAEGSISVTATELLLTGSGIDFTSFLAGPGLLSLSAAGTVNESATAVLEFATAAGTAGGFGLIGGNSFGTVGNISASGNIVLDNAESLVIAGLVQTPATISLEGQYFREIGGGKLDTATLDSGGTTIGGDVFLTNANEIGVLDDFYVTAGSTLAFDNSQALYLFGNVVADYATISAPTLVLDGNLNSTLQLTLGSSGNIRQFQGTIDAGTLSSEGVIGGNLSLTDSNLIKTLANVSVSGTLDVADAVALTLAGKVDAPFATLDAAGLDFNGGFTAANLLVLESSADVTQSSGTIDVGTLATEGNIGGAITLLDGNLIGTLGGIRATGNIAISNIELLDIAGLVSASGTITLENTAGIDEVAGGTLAAAVFTSGGTAVGGDVSLANANQIGTLANVSLAAGHTLFVSNASALTLAGTILADYATLSASALDFTGVLENILLALGSSGAVTQSGGGITASTVISLGEIGGNVALTGSNRVGTLTGFSLASGGTLVFDNATLLAVGGVTADYASLSAAGLAFFGNVDAAQVLALGSSDGISQSAGTITAGTLISDGAVSGDVTLGDQNAIGTIGAFSLDSGYTLAVRDAGLLDLGGPITADFATFGAGSISLNGGVSIADLLALASAGGIKQTGGTVSAGTLVSDGSIGGNVFLTSALNDITRLGDFTVGSGDTLDLVNGAALTLAGEIIAPYATFAATSLAISGTLDDGGVLALVSAGGVSETGSITAGTLTSLGETDGNVFLTAANSIQSVASFTVGLANTFALDDGGLLTVSGPLSGGTITLSSATIAIPGSIIGTDVALESGGSVYEDGGAIFATSLTSGGTTIGGNVSLLGGNTIGTLGNFALDGNFALSNAGTLIIEGALVTPNGDVTFEDTTGGVLESGGSIVAGTLDTGGTTLGGNMILLGQNTIANLSALTLGAGDTLNLANAGLLTIEGTVFAPFDTLSSGSFQIEGALNGTLLALASLGTIHETTGTIGAGTLISEGAIGGDAYLTAGNEIGTLANFTMAAGTTLYLTDLEGLVLAGDVIAPNASFSAPSLTFAGTFDAGQVLALTSATSVVEEAGAAIIAGTLTSLGSVDGDVILLSSGNTIGTIGVFTVGAGDTFALEDSGLLTVQGPLAGPAITLSSPTIAIPGTIDASILLALVSSASVTETGTVTAGTLTSLGETDGDVFLTAANSIQSVASFTVGLSDTFALDDSGLLTVSGPLSGGTITLSSATIAIPGSIIGTDVALESGGSVYEDGGAIFATSLTSGGTTIGGNVSLLGGNSIGTLGNFALDGNFALSNAGTLIIEGALVTPNGDVTFEDTTGGVIESGGSIVAGTLDTGGTTLGGNMILLGQNTIANLGALTLGAGDTLNLANAGLLNIEGTVFAPFDTLSSGSFQIAGALNGGVLALASPGTIHETTGTIGVGTLQSEGTIGGDAYLTAGNEIGTLANFTMAAGTTLDLTDLEDLVLAGNIIAPNATFAAPSLTVAGTIDTSEVLALTGGAVFEAANGAIIAGTLTSLGSIDGDVILLGPGNVIGTIGVFDVGAVATFALQDTGLLTVAGPLGGPTITLSSPTIAIPGTIDATDILALESTGTIFEDGGTIAALTLSSGGTTIGGNLSLIGANTIGTLGDIDVAGNFALSNTSTLIIEGSLVAPNGTVTLEDASSVTEAGGLIIAKTLNSGGTTIGGGVRLDDANQIADLGNFTLAAGQTFSLVDSTLTVAGTVFAPFTTFTALTIAIAGAVDGTLLDFGTGTDVAETSGTIAETVLTTGTQTAGTISLLNRNAIGTLGAFGAAGRFALYDAENLDIDGRVGSASTITLEGAGNITEAAGGTLAAPNLDSGGTTIGGAVSLLNSNAIGTLGPFAAAQNISFADGVSYTIGGVVYTGQTLAFAGDGMSESGGGLIVAAALITDGALSGNAVLNGANSVASLGNFALSGDLLLADDVPLALTGAVNVGGTLGLLDSGAIVQTGGGVTASALTSDGGVIGGSAVLTGANDIATLAAFSAAGGLTLNNLINLAIDGPVDVGGTLGLSVQGNVVQTGGTISAAALTTGGGSITGQADFHEPGNQIAAIGNARVLGGMSLYDSRALALTGNLYTGLSPLNLNAAGFDIIEIGGVITAGTVRLDGAGIVLADANSIAALGAVTAAYLRAAGVASITGPLLAGTATVSSPGNLIVTGDVSVSGTLSLAGYSIEQLAGSIIAGDEYLRAGGNGAGGGIDFAGIDLAAGTLYAAANGPVEQSAGTLAAGVIDLVSYRSNVTQSAGAVMNGGDIYLGVAQFGGVLVYGALSASNVIDFGGIASVTDDASLLQAADVNVFGQHGVVLNGNNVVSGQFTVRGASVEQQSGTVQAGTLTVYGDSYGVILHGTVLAQAATLHDYGVFGQTFSSDTGLQLGGAISIAGALDLISGAGIYETGGTVRAGTVFAVSTVDPGNNVVLDGALYDSGLLSVAAAGVISQNASPLSAADATFTAAGITLNGFDHFDNFTAQAARVLQTGGFIDADVIRVSASGYAGLDGVMNALDSIVVTAGGNIVQNNGDLLAADGTFSAAGSIALDAAGSFSGTLDLVAGGDIFHTGGGGYTLSAGTLTGGGNQLAQFTEATDFATIGSFVLQDSTFSLINIGPLTIIGPLVANEISITATGLLTLAGSPTGGLFVTGVNEPKTQLTPTLQDSVLTVLPSADGAAPELQQIGTFFINAGPEAAFFPAFANQPATLYVEVGPDGALTFAPAPPTTDGLFAPTISLMLGLGPEGTATGNVDVYNLVVLSGLSTNLTGILDGVGGSAGAGKGTAEPFPKPPYQFNACPLGSVNCIILPIISLPSANPLQNFDIDQRKRKKLNQNVALPGVATRDF